MSQTSPTGRLTASFKVERKEVSKRYVALIEEMCSGSEGAQSRAA